MRQGFNDRGKGDKSAGGSGKAGRDKANHDGAKSAARQEKLGRGLVAASRRGDLDKIESLMTAGADIHYDGEAALRAAALDERKSRMSGFLLEDTLRTLLLHGADAERAGGDALVESMQKIGRANQATIIARALQSQRSERPRPAPAAGAAGVKP